MGMPQHRPQLGPLEGLPVLVMLIQRPTLMPEMSGGS